MKTKLWFSLLLIVPLVLVGCTPKVTAPSPTPPSQVDNTTPISPPKPIKTASISGTITLKGAVTQGSTVLMLQKLPEAPEYTEFARMVAADGSEWNFRQAVEGELYDITAALQVDEENAATGNVVTVTAPASGQVINLSSDLNLPAPNSAARLESCGDPDGTGNYNATIFFPHVKGAAGYYYQVGSEPGKDDVDKNGIKAPENPNDDPTTTVYVKGDQDIFARYAYTECVDCNVYDKQNWSGWSQMFGFKCPK